MRWLPERLPFSYRLLIAFAVPLFIWVMVSVFSIYALHRAEQSYEALSDAGSAAVLINQYRAIIHDAREVERAYLLTSSRAYLEQHQEVIRRAAQLHDELGWHVRDRPEQARRLDAAAEALQRWFFDYSRPRVQARFRLPYEGVRQAQRVQQKLLTMLIAQAPAANGENDIKDLGAALSLLEEQADRGSGARTLQQALDRLERYQAALANNDRDTANDELIALAELLEPALTEIIEAEEELYARVSEVGSAELVNTFDEATREFAQAEEALVVERRARARFAMSLIHWIVWLGLVASVFLMIIVLVWFIRRLGHSIESIDHAAGELARGNLSARARGEGSASKLAEHFNAMADLIEKRHEQTRILARLGETLHNCHSITEALKVFGEFSLTLFPDHPGVLYLVEPNQVDVTAVAAWNGGESCSRSHLVIEDCWGLRLTRMHENGSNGTVQCHHLKDDSVDSLCVPLPAFGQIIGMLFIVLGRKKKPEPDRERQRQFVDTVAEQVALALANVKLREELRIQAIRDPLTQLYNRRHLDDIMEREMQRAERHNVPLAVLAFDIDHFKPYNDTHGHDGGDVVLRRIGETLRDLFRPEDGIFRAGGEEFIAVLPATSHEDAIARAEDLRKAIANMAIVKGNVHLPSVTISVGVATYPDNASDSEHLLKAADLALYEAKDRGRDRVVSAADL